MPPIVKLTRIQTLNRLKRVIASFGNGGPVLQSHRLSGPTNQNGLGFATHRPALTREINIVFADVGVKMTTPEVDAQDYVYELRDAIWKKIPKKHQLL